MKVVVTSTGPGLDDELDPRFGRCQYFLIVDTDTMEVLESLSNEGIMASGGAGIQAGQFVANKGAEAVVTGNVGPNAIQTLQAAGIGVYLAPPGTVRQAIEAFKKEALEGVSTPPWMRIMAWRGRRQPRLLHLAQVWGWVGVWAWAGVWVWAEVWAWAEVWDISLQVRNPILKSVNSDPRLMA